MNKTKTQFIFHKEYMSFVMAMDQMENMFQVLLQKLFIVIFTIILDSLKQCLDDGKIDETVILETYRKIDMELDNSNFDTSFSGCTCVSLVRHDHSLFCINLGDSKAIMVKGFNVINLTKSHKPDVPSEK